jgi:hypothetical protein
MIVEIWAMDISTEALRREQEALTLKLQEEGLDVRLIPFRRRTPDPAVFVTLVASAIGALIAGICAVVSSRGNRKIVVEKENGGKIEVPADFTLRQIEELLSLTQDSSPVKRIKYGEKSDNHDKPTQAIEPPRARKR